MSRFFRIPRLGRSLIASLVLLAAPMAPWAHAADAPKKELSDRVSEQLGKIRTDVDAKNYDAALKVLEDLRPHLTPNTYDVVVVSQITAQLYLQKGQFASAIAPLEQALQVADKFGYFDKKTTLEAVYYLAQLYMQEGMNQKGEAQDAEFQKAIFYMQRYMADNPNPNPDAVSAYASVLFNMAQRDPNHVDFDLIRKARGLAEDALNATLRPKEAQYVLLLAADQQLTDNKSCAEVLETLVAQFPSNKTYWQNLASTYLVLAGEEKKPERSFRYNIRAINSIERAQKYGIMTSPKDNFNLIGIYFNIQQYGKATSLLDKGLHDGSIENDLANWKLLAYSYQQLNKELDAIATLKEAATLFPKDGQVEYQIAQLYYGLDDSENALKHLQLSVDRGGGEKPAQVYLFMAYVAYELHKFDVARTAVDKASEFDGVKDEAARMKKAIDDAVEARRQEIEGPAKKA